MYEKLHKSGSTLLGNCLPSCRCWHHRAGDSRSGRASRKPHVHPRGPEQVHSQAKTYAIAGLRGSLSYVRIFIMFSASPLWLDWHSRFLAAIYLHRVPSRPSTLYLNLFAGWRGRSRKRSPAHFSRHAPTPRLSLNIFDGASFFFFSRSRSGPRIRASAY